MSSIVSLAAERRLEHKAAGCEVWEMSSDQTQKSGDNLGDKVEGMFLTVVAFVLMLSLLGLVLCIVRFDDYVDAFVVIHRSSFDGIEDARVRRWIMGVLLLIRSLAALSWVTSFFYLKKTLAKATRKRFLLMRVYSIASACGFGYLALRAELASLEAIRVTQASICSFLAAYLCFQSLKTWQASTRSTTRR